MATPRTPSPKPSDPNADHEKRVASAHSKALKKAIDNFVHAANEWHAALPGTIGKQQAAVRAKACRKALDGTVAAFVKRERLDAHGVSFQRSVAYLESYQKHESMSAEESRVLERAARKITAALNEMRRSVEAQRNALDEQVLGQ